MPIGAAIGGAVATVGGAALGASAQKKAAKKAANTELQNTQTNNAFAQHMYDLNSSALAPYQATGTAAGTKVNAALGNGPYGGPALTSSFVNSAMNPGSFDNFRESTGYDWRLAQGVKALDIGYGAKGALQSGAALKGVVSFGQNLASDEYQRYLQQLDRFTSYTDAWNTQQRGYATDQYNTWITNLSDQQRLGLSAASAQAGVGQNLVGTVTANNNQAASAAANAALARGNATGGMYAQTGNALGYLAGQIGSPSTSPYSYTGYNPVSTGTVSYLRPDVNMAIANNPGVF